ncbi:MAG: alpha/beta hydrolase [Chloroflexota bacterium]|nr:alpha/beta hydrolase [Chloroflexota bacterium]
MPIPTLSGVTAKTVTTNRIATRVLFTGPEHGIPVLFLHGNTSSATWWEETMLALPAGYRGVAPDQRGFGEADPARKIDASRGLGDLADDAVSLLDQLGIAQARVIGHSLGGSVIWRLLMDYPARLCTATLANPGSPYGFGSTRDVDGTPCWADFSGSGGGLSNPELIKRLAEGDRSTDSPFSPRSALRTLLVKPPFVPAREEDLVSSMLSTHSGGQDVPGDKVLSANWPFVAPGVWGPANALSPKYAGDPARLYAAARKVNILWIRGSHDLVVSDTALSDPGFLGMSGFIPGWPGLAVYPPQPMVSQTRAVLEGYARAGGAFREVVIQETGHSPYLEKLDEFNAAFHAHLGAA